MRKPAFCICENKDADQLRGKRKLISTFVFATRIVQSLYFLNVKFQASCHLLWLYSLVCIGPGRKLSQTDAHMEKGTLIHEAKLKNVFASPDPYQKNNDKFLKKKLCACICKFSKI